MVAVVGVLAPVIAPYDPHALAGESLEAPSPEHLLGTNDIGQDLLSQLVWGTRAALVVAVAGAGAATLLGGLVGAGVGLLGGAADAVTMRAIDTFMAMPGLPLMAVIATMVGPSRPMVVLLIGMIGWPLVARTVRNQALSLHQRGFVAASRGFGAGRFFVLRHHLVPALGPVLVSRFVVWAPTAVFIHAGLAYLGLAEVGEVSWGSMLNKAQTYQGLYFTPLWTSWVLPPGFAISITVLGFTLVGIGSEPWFNPRIRESAQ